MDRQSLEGKLVGRLVRRAAAAGVGRVVAICGRAEAGVDFPHLDGVYPIYPDRTPEETEAMVRAADFLREIAATARMLGA